MGSVDSSNVKDVNYDSRTKVLEIQFTHGGKYKYNNISRQRFSAFIRSESLGAYVNEHFRDIKCQKIK
jgi:KTSC domain